MPDESNRPRPRSARFAQAAAFALAVPLALVAPRLYAQMRVGVVNIQQAILETDQGHVARNQLRHLFTQRQQELDHRQEGLRQLREQLEKERSSVDRATLARRMEDYQKQFVELQQSYTDFQQELAQREAELTKQIYANLQVVVRQMGQEQNYTAIFEQSGIVWATQGYDMTDTVVRQYNRTHPADASVPEGGHTADATAPAPAAEAGVAVSAGADAGARAGDGGPRVFANPHPRGENAPPQR